MVHRFRLVIGDEDVVSEINDIFEMLLLELLINYKIYGIILTAEIKNI